MAARAVKRLRVLLPGLWLGLLLTVALVATPAPFATLAQADAGRVVARVLAQEGGEQIMEAAMAIRFGISVSEIAAMYHPYLTQAEGVKLCAQTFTKDVKKLSCCSA